VTPAAANVAAGPHLRLRIVDTNGQAIAARFTLTVDGAPYTPARVSRGGLRFVSIHQRRKQQFVATYARGKSEILIPLPDGARRGAVTAAKGFEFAPAAATFEIERGQARAKVTLRRWIDLQSKGWHAADEHLHYERTAQTHDADWLTMLDADGLSHAHFLVLKGGNLPGVWAQQYEYGEAGEAKDGERLIRSGEEYRDSSQGHINLLGVERVIEPISTGGIGEPRVPHNFPPLLDVFRRTHELGGIGGPAHGGSLARSSTAALDTVLGQVDFIEIANSHLFKTDVWYGMLNCGFMLPPVAGTDLPNFGFRDSWQPLLGEVRTYVQCGERRDFAGWKEAVRRGEVFVTSGPLIQVEVGGRGPGGVVKLPPQGGEVTVSAELASPRPLQRLEIIRMGRPEALAVKRTQSDGIHRLSIEQKLKITESCWLAARGAGGPKTAIEQGLRIRQDAIAHTGVVQVIVGDKPIRSLPDVKRLRRQLIDQQEFYRTRASYAKAADRVRFVKLFDEALERLSSTNGSRR
jgi:hypothetical protein